MPKFFVKNNQVSKNKISIYGDDVNHIKNVLRLQVDNNIEICNAELNINYLCSIEKIMDDVIDCKILSSNKSKSESNIELHIFQGLPKADKMELIIQKSVELGVKKIYPLEMERCVVKLDEKNAIKKIDRWQKISEVAAKQSGRDMIPMVENIITVENLCKLIKNYDVILLAYEGEKNNYIKNELIKFKNSTKLKIGIIIGPEGGITEGEVETLKEGGAKVITLGNRILRTETVALTLSSIIMYELGDIGGVK